MRFMRAFLVSVLLFAVGCATPPEVKQALVSLDRSYAEIGRPSTRPIVDRLRTSVRRDPP